MLESGYLLGVHIAGYEPFLTGVELEHGQAILSELVETLLQQAKSIPSTSIVQQNNISGTVHVCAHGNLRSILRQTIELVPDGGGTQVSWCIAKVRGETALSRLFWWSMNPMMEVVMQRQSG